MYHIAIRLKGEPLRYYAVDNRFAYWAAKAQYAQPFVTKEDALQVIRSIRIEPHAPQPNGDIHPGRLTQSALLLDLTKVEGEGDLVLFQVVDDASNEIQSFHLEGKFYFRSHSPHSY